MTKKNPIKFLDAYTKNDLDIFFGREKETNTLYEKINQAKVVLLYGLSGTGKTSLIQCGLENKCNNDNLTFLYIRRGKNIIDSIRKVVEEKADSMIHPKASPYQAFETLYYDYLTPLLIVFDQFEELFISGDDDEKEKFIQAFYEILQSNIKVKFIISLREEYLAYLDDFEKEIPSLFDYRYRVERMRRNTLEDVIINITKKAGIELENEKIPGLIFENLPLKMGFIELPDLQVYLDKLTVVSKNLNSDSVFTEAVVREAEEQKDVLLAFLEDVLKEFKPDKTFAESVLKQLITEEGTKKQLYISDFALTDGADKTKLNNVLEVFRTSKIIKFNDSVYELSHDSLAKKVAERRTKEESELHDKTKLIAVVNESTYPLSKDQLIEIAPFYEKLEEHDKAFFNESRKINDENEKKKRRKQRTVLVLGSIAILLSGLLITWFLIDKKRDYEKELAVNATFSNKIKSAMNFYNNQFALSFNGEKYGFVDTLANPKIGNRYEWAEHIGKQSGQAICYLNNNPYLIDAREDKIREHLMVNLSNYKNLSVNQTYQDNVEAIDFSAGIHQLSQKDLDSILNLVFHYSPIQILLLGSNKLDSLPAGIKNLVNLRDLQLPNNEIKSLPPEIKDLENLSYLNISGNLLDSLPPYIGELSNLKELDVSFNQLVELPTEIGKLSKLESLYISDYRFESLIMEVKKLSGLTGLKKLFISSGNLSKTKEDEIRELLPNCEIIIIRTLDGSSPLLSSPPPSSPPPSSPPSSPKSSRQQLSR